MIEDRGEKKPSELAPGLAIEEVELKNDNGEAGKSFGVGSYTDSLGRTCFNRSFRVSNSREQSPILSERSKLCVSGVPSLGLNPIDA